MKQINRRIQFAPSVAEAAQLLKVAPTIHLEWRTVLLLSLDVGVSANRGRHLQWEDIKDNGTSVSFTAINTDEAITRVMPQTVVEHLKRLPRQSTYLCPYLHALTNYQFSHQWKRLRAAAGIPDSRSLTALTWKYRELNASQIGREKRLRHLLRLSKKWLTAPEIEALLVQVPKWEKLGARMQGRKSGLIVKPQLALETPKSSEARTSI